MRAGNFLCNVRSLPETLSARADVLTREGLEQAVQSLLRYRIASVGHAQYEFAHLRLSTHPDRPIWRAAYYRVRKKAFPNTSWQSDGT